MPLTFNSDRTAAKFRVMGSASASAVIPPRQSRHHSCVGALLVQERVITEAQLQAAIEQQQRTGRRLAQVLIEMGATTQDAVIGTLTAQLRSQGKPARTSSLAENSHLTPEHR